MCRFKLEHVLAGALVATGIATAQETPKQASDALGRLPLAFVKNDGQWQTPARYVVRHHGQSARFEQDAIVLQLTQDVGEETKGALLRLRFEGASSTATVEGVAQQRCRYNYFLGADPEQWRADVPAYSEVVYRRIQPGVDVRVRDNAGNLEYDLVLAPGADLSKIVIRVGGAQSLEVGADGVLSMETELGTIRQTLPLTWLESANGERQPVECRYRKIDGERFGFEVAGRDESRKLVIDPQLDWSTYLGGLGDDWARCVAVDGSGFVNVSGETTSSDFPTTKFALRRVLGGPQDAFCARLDPSQTGAAQLVWCTYLGGHGSEYGGSLVVDAAGRVTLGGQTDSTNFPTTPGAFSAVRTGGFDGFVVQLDPSQRGVSQLVWSTYFGGSADDFTCIPRNGLSANGIVTVYGNTQSKDFPSTPNAYDTTYNGSYDTIVARFDPSQTGVNQLLYSTFFGGSGQDSCNSAEVDAAGRVTLGGWVNSTDFPTTIGAYSTTLSGGFDAWLARIDPNQIGNAQLVYSTYIGGSGDEGNNSLRIAADGTVYFTGSVSSKNFPTTPGAYDTTFNGPIGMYDSYVVHLDPSGNGRNDLLYSTFVGGSNSNDAGFAMALGRSGEVTVTGWTTSNDFPTTSGCLDPTYHGMDDVFVYRLRPAGNGAADLTYSTYLGTADDEYPGYNWSVDLDANDFPVVVGTTNSTLFPLNNEYQSTNAGGYDCFITRLALSSWFNYGTGLSGTNGVPTFTSQSNPVIGSSLTLDLGNSLGATTPGYLLVGLADANLSAAGGTLLVDAFLFLPISVPATGLPMTGSIPNDPTLTGTSIYLQALEADPAASHGIAFTQGLRLILGY